MVKELILYILLGYATGSIFFIKEPVKYSGSRSLRLNSSPPSP
jgi:predicted permease